MVGAAWTLFTYLHDNKKPSAPTATVVNSSQSIIAPGSTFNGPVSVFDEKKNREEIKAELKPVLEAIARDKGVPNPLLLRATLTKMGEENVHDEDIPALLGEKADELVRLRKTIAALKSAYPDLASSIQQIQASVDEGQFSGGSASGVRDAENAE